MRRDPSLEEEIFHVAAGMDSETERQVYLDHACGDDAVLRRGVEALLRQYSSMGDFLDNPAPLFSQLESAAIPSAELAATAVHRSAEDIGMVIAGKYKLKQKLGSGGMGIVFVAHQREPVDRKVAVKIIKPGYESAEIVARFEQERQALALLDHPNVARIIDGGQTELGRPYFVMELVNGVPITDYCDENKLSIEERIQLFIPVCNAVQHAHQKGIIHRDIKPSNVLIALYDGQPVPKVIDFGIAKATRQRLTEKSIFTEVGKIIGTLEYMSPEQAELNQLDIDTRSDIYSLGVVLYELLTGVRPIDSTQLESAAFLEKLRIIREFEPQKPSTKLSSAKTLPRVAAHRKIEPRRLCKFIDGDLDWIVMKALAKERVRRYDSASSFALDLKRFLALEPVLAGPPSKTYLLAKSFRRHRSAYLASAIFVLTLLIGIVATTIEWRQALHAEQRANLEMRNANATIEFLTDDLLSQAVPDSQIEAYSVFLQSLTIRQALDRAMAKAELRFKDQPDLAARVSFSLGKSYFSLGEFDTAKRFLLRAKDADSPLAADEEFRSKCLVELGRVYSGQTNHAEAARAFRDALNLQQGKFGLNHPLTLKSRYHLACALLEMDKDDQALAEFREVYEKQRALLGENDSATLQTRRMIANVEDKKGNYNESERILIEILDRQRKTLGVAHTETQTTWNNLAATYLAKEDFRKAVNSFQALIDASANVQAEDHPMRLINKNNLASAYFQAGEYDKAIAILQKIVPQLQEKLSLKNESALAATFSYAMCLKKKRNFTAAEKHLLDALDGCMRMFGADDERTISIVRGLEQVYIETKDSAKIAKMRALLHDHDKKPKGKSASTP